MNPLLRSLHDPTSAKRHQPALLVVLAILITAVFTHTSRSIGEEPSAKLSPDHEAFFESKIRPLLVEHCYECHSEQAGEASGEFKIDSGPAIRSGGTSGPAIVAGDTNASLLIKAVRYQDPDYEMPPTGKLDDEQIRLLEHWVEIGAPDPRQANSTKPNHASPMDIDPKSHWAFNTPLRFPGVVQTNDGDLDLIDSVARNIAADSGITVAQRCSDDHLVRRLYYDLTGLPPTIEQVETFVQSQRPDKVDRVVDQLLASPEFGERFARHWMDVARYADTVGYALAGKERRLKGSERYRDWLVKAFAGDMPYDEMIRLQLAADRFDPENKSGNLDAMGFLTVGRRFLSKFDTVDDRIDVITRGLMGMTVGCARCHDHKFDPIPTADYYSLLGILQSSEPAAEGASPLALVDKAKPSDSAIFVRGQAGNRGAIAPRQYLTALRAPDETPFTDGSGRLELAERLASADNPLVSRVFVNRIWMHVIGTPIIDSTSDFGVRTRQTELAPVLDDLSAEFSQHWSVKRLIRRIVTSRIYAQSASIPQPTNTTTDQLVNADPENRFAARANRRRKDFESMRDSALAVAGQLDLTVGGAPVEIHLSSPSTRRSVYAMIDRQNLPSLFRTFDFASPDAHTPKRLFTTVPQQALFLMNHTQIGTLAQSIVKHTLQEGSTNEQHVTQLFHQLFSRNPSEEELDACVAFVGQTAKPKINRFDPKRAWHYGTTPANDECSVTQFRPLRTFSGSSWQDETKLPASSELSYASLALENGHPGPKHSVVRRWTAPADGTVRINGTVGHRNKQGDGVELAIWIGANRVFRENQKSNNRPFKNLRGTIRKGESIDFVVSPRESDSFDSFFLTCQISMRSNDGKLFEADSKKDFSGPLGDTDTQTLNRLAQLAQTLLLSNEFMFVD